MTVKFDVQGPGGQEQDVELDAVIGMLQQDGEQVTNVSPDGMTLQIAGKAGPVSVPVAQVLQNYGLTASNAIPTNPDYSQVSREHRNAIVNIPDEDLKKVYLQSALQKSGIKNPQILGSGRDFFYFDPTYGKYIALTNNPDWDESDKEELYASGPRIAGSIVGGALGAAAGPMGIAAGSALGGFLGNTGSQAINAYFNPESRNVMAENMGTMAKQAGVNAVIDAGAGLIPAKVPAMFSGAARGAGRVMQGAGKVIGGAAKLADNPVGHNIASSVIPVAAETTTAGLLGQLPGQAVRGITKGMGWLGEREGLKQAFPGMASRLRGLSESLLTTPLPAKSNIAEEVAAKLGGKAVEGVPVGATERILRGAGEKIARRVAPNRVEQFGELGGKLGRAIQSVEDASRGLEAAGNVAGAGLIKGIRSTGYVTGKTGQAVKAAGTAFAPLENRLIGRYGAEEAYDYLKPKRPWQMTGDQDTINSVLASSNY